MNNKIITGIVCALIVVCLAVGIGMNLKNGNPEEKTNLISNTETGSAAVESTEAEKISTENEEKTQTAITSKRTSPTTETNAEKTENTTKRLTKPSAKPSLTTKKETSSAKATESNSLSVSFSVNCEKAVDHGADYPNYLIGKTNCNVKEGITVFDLLIEQCRKNGIAVVHQNKSYIVSIGGLAEKDCGNASGWMYKVNGVKVMMSASKCVLKNGDIVEWYYVTSPTD